MRIMELDYHDIESDYPDLNFMLPYNVGRSGTLNDA